MKEVERWGLDVWQGTSVELGAGSERWGLRASRVLLVRLSAVYATQNTLCCIN